MRRRTGVGGGGLGFTQSSRGTGGGGLGFIVDQTKARGGGNLALDAMRKPGRAPVAGSQSAWRAAKRITTVAVVAPGARGGAVHGCFHDGAFPGLPRCAWKRHGRGACVHVRASADDGLLLGHADHPGTLPERQGSRNRHRTRAPGEHEGDENVLRANGKNRRDARG